MEQTECSENDVRTFIEKIVADHWESDNTAGSAILLSVLGGLVKEKFPNFQVVIGSGLKAYLASADIAQSVTYPGVSEKTGLIPKGVPLPDDIRELFPKTIGSSMSLGKPRYRLEFWNAFFHDIKSHRYVKLSNGDKVEVLDVNSPQSDSGVFEITKADIVNLPSDSTIQVKAEATREKIDAWLERHGLESSAFFRSEGGYSESRNASSKLRALEIALGHLSHADQARIMIPLDVLFKIVK